MTISTIGKSKSDSKAFDSPCFTMANSVFRFPVLTLYEALLRLLKFTDSRQVLIIWELAFLHTAETLRLYSIELFLPNYSHLILAVTHTMWHIRCHGKR